MTTPPAIVDQRGSGFSLEALRGHPVVVTFVSARCSDACPLINAQIAQTQTLARERHSPLRFVTITLDPAHDSRRDMQKIGSTFGADPSMWQLVSGRPKAIAHLMHRFGVVTQAGAGGVPTAHSTYVYMLDRKGRIVRTFLASSNLSTTLEDMVTP